MTREFSDGRSLQLLKGDITKIPVDAIVNAANSELRTGGGVDGAIHTAAGPSVRIELDDIRAKKGACPPGSAVPTTAGNLPAKFVFHAVGPVYRGGSEGEADLLASAYRTCLQLADEKKVAYISFPAISAGIYGYPMREAADIALREVIRHLEKGETSLRRVLFVLYDDRALRTWGEALRTLAPATDTTA